MNNPNLLPTIPVLRRSAFCISVIMTAPCLLIIPTTTTGLVNRPGSARHPTMRSSSTWRQPTQPTMQRWLIRKPTPTSISPGSCVRMCPKVKSPGVGHQCGSPMGLPGTRDPAIDNIERIANVHVHKSSQVLVLSKNCWNILNCQFASKSFNIDFHWMWKGFQ